MHARLEGGQVLLPARVAALQHLGDAQGPVTVVAVTQQACGNGDADRVGRPPRVPREVAGLAASGATVAICPTTEANLGDGLFPLRAYLDAGGRFGIGSDSHVSTSPVEEWRWLEYGQRLQQRSRICAQDSEGRLAEPMLLQSLQAGGRVARPDGGHAWAPGHRADVVMLDSAAPELAALPPERHSNRGANPI